MRHRKSAEELGARLRRRLARALLAMPILVVAEALADGNEPRFALSWTRLPGATQCISSKALAQEVEDHLGHRVFDAPGHADVAIEGHVERAEAGGWYAVISVTDAKGAVLGTRELSSADPSCRDLDAPLALTIALFVDPTAMATVRADVPPVPMDPAPLPEAEARRAAPPPKPRRAPPERGWSTWAEVGGGVAFGVLPGPAPGLVTRIGMEPPLGWPVVFSAALFMEQERTLDPGAEPVGLALTQGGLAVCPLRARSASGAVRACGGLDAGVVSTRGLSEGAILQRRRFALAFGSRLEGDLHLGSQGFLGVAAGLGVPMVRDSFEYERNGHRELVFRMAAVTASIDVGIGFRSR